jgi:predicted Zn-dependent peptidase
MLNIALINPQSFELSNGFAVSLACDFSPAKPYSAMVFLAKCGLYTENSENNGITHALEHILFKGSRKYSNYQITSIINKLGGSLDAFTTSDSLGIEVQIPHAHIPKALEVLSQLALNPLFPEGEIELEKKVIIEEMRFYRDDPEDLVMLKLEKACYKGSCYSREILGTPQSVGRLTAASLAAYHRDYFTPSNCSITIAGAFNSSEISAAVEEHFGAGVWKNRNSPPKNDDYLGVKNTRGRYIIKKRDKFIQNYYAIGFVTPSSLSGGHICAMFLPYVFSSLKSSPLLYMLKDEYNAVNGLTTDLVFKYGMWMLTVLASAAPSKISIVKAEINNFISCVSRFVSQSYFESIKKCFLLDYIQEIENPRTYCGELSTFNHILGKGSYNHAAKAIMELEYPAFINYLRVSVETCDYNSVELTSASFSKPGGGAFKPLTPLLNKIAKFDSARRPETLKPLPYGNIGVARFSGAPGIRDAKITAIGSNSMLCSMVDPSTDYSTLTLFIKGGVAGSFKSGDANIAAELFGRKTIKSTMYENYMLSDSRGIYFDCNSYLDYFKLEAATAGGWTDEKISYLKSLFTDFHFNKAMLNKSKSAVKNLIKSIQDDVFELSFWGFLTNLFENTPYKKAVVSNENKINDIAAGDILKYYDSVIKSPFISMAVSSPQNCSDIISDNFSELFSRPAGPDLKVFSGDPESFKTFSREIKSRQAQCTIVIGSPAPAFGESGSAAFSAANYILSDYAGRRLWNIRENFGLCYNIFSEYIPLGLAGAFFCYANASAGKIELTAEKIIAEIERFAREGPSPAELEDAKTQLIKRFENSSSFSASAARLIGQQVFYERSAAACLNYVETIQNLTCESVRAAFGARCRPQSLSRLKIMAG